MGKKQNQPAFLGLPRGRTLASRPRRSALLAFSCFAEPTPGHLRTAHHQWVHGLSQTDPGSREESSCRFTVASDSQRDTSAIWVTFSVGYVVSHRVILRLAIGELVGTGYASPLTRFSGERGCKSGTSYKLLLATHPPASRRRRENHCRDRRKVKPRVEPAHPRLADCVPRRGRPCDPVERSRCACAFQVVLKRLLTLRRGRVTIDGVRSQAPPSRTESTSG